ncbi:MAG TPA: hypothetical protein VL485_07375 [Ktedonobacteraceae bacterium]|jgi:hypothetical protein|nr:hypothetical protein [Ktedonobacteraceae bacterium]
MTLDRPVGRRQTSWHTFSVASKTVERAERYVCGVSGIARVRGRHSAAASWRPYWVCAMTLDRVRIIYVTLQTNCASTGIGRLFLCMGVEKTCPSKSTVPLRFLGGWVLAG